MFLLHSLITDEHTCTHRQMHRQTHWRQRPTAYVPLLPEGRKRHQKRKICVTFITLMCNNNKITIISISDWYFIILASGFSVFIEPLNRYRCCGATEMSDVTHHHQHYSYHLHDDNVQTLERFLIWRTSRRPLPRRTRRRSWDTSSSSSSTLASATDEFISASPAPWHLSLHTHTSE